MNNAQCKVPRLANDRRYVKGLEGAPFAQNA